MTTQSHKVEINDATDKVLGTILSCETLEQLTTCEKLINNFKNLFSESEFFRDEFYLIELNYKDKLKEILN